MKRLLCIVTISLVGLLGWTARAGAADTGADFTVRSWPYTAGEELEYREHRLLQARYSDDLTQVALCEYYDGYMFATVHAANAQRPLETFMSANTVFSDDDSSFEFWYLEKLSASGVIKGDANGAGRPFAPVSRAEAVAMLVRLLGLPLDNDAAAGGFSDVAANAWYAPAVDVAVANGVVSADQMFYPDREVSRQEFVTMTGRAMRLAGLLKLESTDASGLRAEDGELIAGWALPAYIALDDDVPADRVEDLTQPTQEGGWEYLFYYRPQRPALRHECADLLWSCLEHLQVYPSRQAVGYGFDGAMPVIDGSTSTYPFTREVYQALFPLLHLTTQHQKFPRRRRISSRPIRARINILGPKPPY